MSFLSKNKFTLAVLAAGTLWGFMGFFRRSLDDMGLSTMGCIVVRCGFACLLFALTMLIMDPKMFRVKLRDAWIFLGCGIFSTLIFELCYFKAMDYMSLSNAAILLYTAPIFVIIMSAILFKESLTKKKLAAMLLAFIGCCFVCGIGGGDRIGGVGFLFGLGSGIFYASFSIFSRFAIKRGYSTFTLNFYITLIGTLGALIIDGTDSLSAVTTSMPNILLALLTGLVTCYMPYLLYTYGLTGLENGKASIMASVEPVVATLCGYFIYSELLSGMNIIGVVLVLSTIVLLNIKNNDKKPS